MEQRRICPYCMQELEAGEEQCPHCGRELAGRNPSGSLPAEVVVAVPAHVRVPVPEAGEPDARKKIFTEQSLRQWQSARR